MTELLMGFRTEMAKHRMKPAPTVECLNVVEEVIPRFVTGPIHTMAPPLALQGAEGSLHPSGTYQASTSLRQLGSPRCAYLEARFLGGKALCDKSKLTFTPVIMRAYQ
jgi:hypothetical protein